MVVLYCPSCGGELERVGCFDAYRCGRCGRYYRVEIYVLGGRRLASVIPLVEV